MGELGLAGYRLPGALLDNQQHQEFLPRMGDYQLD
jgi:hypothetical protein